MEVQHCPPCLSSSHRFLSDHHGHIDLLQHHYHRLPHLNTTSFDSRQVSKRSDTMIIDTCDRAIANSTLDSPQQAETVPEGVSTDVDTENYKISREIKETMSLPHILSLNEKSDFQSSWIRTVSATSSINSRENSPDCFTTASTDESCSESALPFGDSSVSPANKHSSSDRLSLAGFTDRLLQRQPEQHCTPLAVPSSDHVQEYSDRRNRRKPTLEDIVRRIVPQQPMETVSFEDDEEVEDDIDYDVLPAIAPCNSFITNDEVDGLALSFAKSEELRQQLLNAQACAETAIKQSLQNEIDICDQDADREKNVRDDFAKNSLLHSGEEGICEDAKVTMDYDTCWKMDVDEQAQLMDSERSMSSSDKRSSPDQTCSVLSDDKLDGRRPDVTVLPKTSTKSPFLPSLNHILRSSLLSPNVSESAYIPHQYFPGKPANGWLPGELPPLFTFPPASIMDSGFLPHGYMPFDSTSVAENEKDYLKCNFCERTFRRQKNLENHMENTHQSTGNQPIKRDSNDMYFKCTHCPYTTKHQSNLYVHLRIHTGERPYICGACGVQYSQSHSLKSHIINKHDGRMNFYIKEKRNRSPRGIGCMSAHMHDQSIFRMPPPPALAGMSQANIDLVNRALEMTRTNVEDGGIPFSSTPPHFTHCNGTSTSFHKKVMSNNSFLDSNGLLQKSTSTFPFNGHFGSLGMPFGDVPHFPPFLLPPKDENMIQNPDGVSNTSPKDAYSNSIISDLSTFSSANPFQQAFPLKHISSRGENCTRDCTPMTNKFSPELLPNDNVSVFHHPLIPSMSGEVVVGGTECGAIDLSFRAKNKSNNADYGVSGDDSDCPQADKLKHLRLNVVRMLSILVPNLNFEEKGISADSDSVDELLQDVIESNLPESEDLRKNGFS